MIRITVTVILCSLTALAGDGFKPKKLQDWETNHAFKTQQTKVEETLKKVDELYEAVKRIDYTDRWVALAKLKKSMDLLNSLGTKTDKAFRKLQRSQRLSEDLRVHFMYWASRKDGGKSLFPYFGRNPVVHETQPWIVIEHGVKPPQELKKLPVYLVRRGRCIAALRFIAVTDTYCIAEIEPHWVESFYAQKKNVATNHLTLYPHAIMILIKKSTSMRKSAAGGSLRMAGTR